MLKNLKGGSLERVQDEELLEEAFAIGGHVEGDAILAPQHPFS